MTIKWGKSHFKMTKNDRDGQGWRWSKYPPSKSLVIPPSFHHSSIILSVKSIHPNPSAEGFGWTDFMLSFGYHPWLIHFIPGPSHHSRITFLILSVKSVHPNPSAEGFGWTELTLPFGYHPWLIHFIPGSSLHSWITPLIQSVKSVHPNPSAEGFGWTDFFKTQAR